MRRQRAFTLIEVLVALAVFGVLSALAYLTLGQTLRNSDMLTERMDRLQAIQRTISYLSNELLQAAPRPIRGDLGQAEPALRSSFAADFALEPAGRDDPARQCRQPDVSVPARQRRLGRAVAAYRRRRGLKRGGTATGGRNHPRTS